MSNKYFMLIIAVVVIGLLGFAIGNKPEKTENTYAAEYTESPLRELPQDRYLSKAEGATVTLYEYSDFECPACVAFYPLVSELKEEYKDDVNFVFRHFPLTSIHPKAMTAHRIAEGSQAQGKFSEVHDLLFEQNQAWVGAANANDAIYSLLESSSIELNIDQLKEDVASKDTADVISAHMSSGQALGVNGTPSFFLNGEKVEPRSIEDFRALLDAAVEVTAN